MKRQNTIQKTLIGKKIFLLNVPLALITYLVSLKNNSSTYLVITASEIDFKSSKHSKASKEWLAWFINNGVLTPVTTLLFWGYMSIYICPPLYIGFGCGL